MALDPVCGMYVEESPETLHAAVRGTTYYFCSEACLREFTRPEVELRSIRLSLALSLSLGIPILVLSYVSLPTGPIPLGWLLFILATPVQFIAGRRFYQGTWNAIKMRSSNMDVLIAIGTSAAFLYSAMYVLFPREFPFGGLYFDTSAIIIALILMGRLLEHTVRGKATDAIRKLVELQPRTTTVIRDGNEREIPTEQVVVGDIFLVRPGERIATDGTVAEGDSSVDEKMVTGESIPIEKTKGSPVIGGAINMHGVLKVKATKVGADTTLSKIVKVIQDAQTTKGPVERLVDTISKYFVPMVLSVAIVSFLSWTLLAHKSVSFGFTTAVAVLIIACPCALGLATPAAIAVGAGKGAENGILIKGGEYLERTQRIDTVVFDKTGTLTKGEPTVTDLVSIGQAGSLTEDEIINLAAMAEKQSEHPLAPAILKEYARRFSSKPLDDPDSFQSLPGMGIEVSKLGKEILFGNQALMASKNIELDQPAQTKLGVLRAEGKTVMVLAVDRHPEGLVAVADTPNEYAGEAVRALQKMKIEVMMLSGDDRSTTAAIARRLGIERYFAEVLPTDKSRIVKQLQSEGRVVAMVGDGINDAPAIAQSDVGIAVGCGSDIAIETGGLVLMRDDLKDVVAGIQLSRKTMTKIKENLVWAFAYNVALIPVAAGLLYLVTGVLLNPILSGAAMALSSVTVISNSLMLRRFRPVL